MRGIIFYGKQTGVKANPADIASKMRMLRSANGNTLFKKEEWFSTLQVERYLSKLSAAISRPRFLEASLKRTLIMATK